ncbi:hypothetical protein [Sphingomonas sp.]|jgi:hypothetical protein|uniref:DUF4139 domain-containing protein n=1 Tax=Sphingomonas sp. TaxID=28214 RepID=UPI002D7FAC7D|nr:hypothetical protein [Sphingomonas sp.]HEU0045369.1 hypothetical protein [Sphingomonas sp.]
MRRAAVLALLTATPATAQDFGATVRSPAPSAVAVTVYRNPDKYRQVPFDLRWLGGFALITETRTVRLPAGPATVRFEGVAGGIVPVSAIVTGLPGGVAEKNRDARLLSPAALIDGYLGRRVTLTRTDRASGRVRVQDAVVVAGPAGGVVVRTPDGVEALGCSGLAEKPRYPAVPAGLTAGPVLSVETASRAATTATVTLSYLTSEFDWSASYVARLTPDGRHLDLFAWLTLANGNAERFPDAQVQAVAGRLNRDARRYLVAAAPLRLDCYPLGTTTSNLRVEQANEDIVVTGFRVSNMSAPPPPPPPPPAMAEAPPPPEDLGDLKLYRVPERVTVNANGQKQVALLARRQVPFARVYRLTLPPAQPVARGATNVALRLDNRVAAGLGLALPAGSTTLYASERQGGLLLGTGRIEDKAVGERVRIGAGTSAQVLVEQTVPTRGQGRIEASNANPFPATVEVALAAPVGNVEPTPGLVDVEGRPTWVATLPANGRATLTYRLRQPGGG